MANPTNGLNRMTPEVLRNLCKKNNLYFTPKLNDVLYLHYQGFQEIAGLDEYTGLKCLWLESNAITVLEGLDNQKELRCLFLQNNLIKKIENLHHCTQLDTLNLSHNQLRSVNNCTSDILPVLSNLTISHNYIRTASDIEELTKCQNLSVLDLSHNKIDDILAVKVFAKMPNLRVLTLVGNPIVGSLPSYRKTLILECVNLTYLDTRPVSAKDRALAEAWKRGGFQGEKEENERWNREERRKMRESINRVLRRRNEIKGQEMTELINSSSDEEEIKESKNMDLNGKFKQLIIEQNQNVTEDTPNASENSSVSPDEEELTVKISTIKLQPPESEDEVVSQAEEIKKTSDEEIAACSLEIDETKCSSNWIIPEIQENLAEENAEETPDNSKISTTATANTTFNDVSAISQGSQTSSPLISILSITIPFDSMDSLQSTPKHKIEVAPKYQKSSPEKKPKEFLSTVDDFLESCERYLEEDRVESERLLGRYTEEVNKSFQEISMEESQEATSDQDFEREIEEIGAKVQNLNEARMMRFREDSKEVKTLIDGVYDRVNKGDEEGSFKQDCKLISNKLEKLSSIIENPPVNQFDEMIEKFCVEGNTENWATDSKMKRIEKFLSTIEGHSASSPASPVIPELSSTDEGIQIEDIEFQHNPHSGEHCDEKVSKDEKEREIEKSPQD